MATEETAIGVTEAPSGLGATPAADSPPAQDTGTQPSQDVNTGLNQPEAVDDPLAGVPSTEDLQPLVEQKAPHAEALLRLRSAYESLKPQYEQLQERFKPVEPYLDRFNDPTEIEQLISLRESLWKSELDEQTGQVVPVTREFAEGISQSAPETANQLTFDLVFGQTRDETTGQPVRRLDMVLQDLSRNEAWKNHILKLMGHDPSQASAPTWEPSAEELERVPEDLRDTYKKLPYDERLAVQRLAESEESGDLLARNYLRTRKSEMAISEQQAEQQRQQQAYQQQQQEIFKQEAIAAGNSYINSQVHEAFSGFFNSLVERYKPTTDPVLNKKFALITAGTVLALSHNETRGPLLAAIKELQFLDDKGIENFNKARDGFAQNAFNYGNKNYVHGKRRGQAPNGNGHDPADLGILKSSAERSLQGLIGQGNAVAAVVNKVLNEVLVAMAGNHNEQLDQADTARQVVSGSPAGVIAANQRQQLTGTTREEIWGRGV